MRNAIKATNWAPLSNSSVETIMPLSLLNSSERINQIGCQTLIQ